MNPKHNPKPFLKAFAAALALVTLAGPLAAQAGRERAAPTPAAAYPSSFRSGETVFVAPYGPLPVRIYTTPPAGPFYNVPPYWAVSPY